MSAQRPFSLVTRKMILLAAGSYSERGNKNERVQRFNRIEQRIEKQGNGLEEGYAIRSDSSSRIFIIVGQVRCEPRLMVQSRPKHVFCL